MRFVFSPENSSFNPPAPILGGIVAASLALACGGILVPPPKGNRRYGRPHRVAPTAQPPAKGVSPLMEYSLLSQYYSCRVNLLAQYYQVLLGRLRACSYAIGNKNLKTAILLNLLQTYTGVQ